MLKDAQPDRFEDIIALVALYRPGPMDLIPSFCARKHGREVVEYPDPRVEPILKETYGIMVYQEQVMQMAQIIGGYSLGGADLLRRAMGKKKAEEMAEHRAIVPRGRGEEWPHRRESRRNLRLDGEVRRLRLQQVARGRLCAARVLHRVAEGAPSGRIHGSEYVARHGRHRQGRRLSQRSARARPDRAAAGRQLVTLSCSMRSTRTGTPRSNTIRYGLGAVKGVGHGAVRKVVDARTRGGAFTRPGRFLPSRRRAARSTSACSKR